ncbi:MAG TPA: type III-A CRISPR-associated protein Csm2 [Candidatus Acidoferrum sp.]|nr:type III-A CRISPR-associated protein Csm2 [Candidatus Acidoferrum sp.]
MAAQDDRLPRIFTDDRAASELVDYAHDLARSCARVELSKTQIRAIYGTVRSLQRKELSERARGLRLLIPKIAYAAARDPALRPLAGPLTEAIVHVTRDSEGFDGRFSRFCEFFEAIVAFHYVASEEAKRESSPRRGGR